MKKASNRTGFAICLLILLFSSAGCAKVVQVDLPFDQLVIAQQAVLDNDDLGPEQKERLLTLYATQAKDYTDKIIDRTDRQAERGLTVADMIIRWLLFGAGLGVAASQ